MHRFRHILALALALGVVFAPPPARAQDAPPDAGVASGSSSGAVAISMEAFGVGEVVRPGEWTGIRLALTDSAPAPRAVAVRLHVRDDDGDEMLIERRVTLNPNRALGLWLYARMPWDLNTLSLFTVTVHELSNPEDGSGDVTRQIAAARIRPTHVFDSDADLIGVIGARPLGLTQLEGRATGALAGQSSIPSASRLATSHQAIEVVLGMSPQALPDMWTGLAPFGVLVWDEPPPSSLGSDLRARAIKEWVRRGGHLVIVLPEIGSEWFAGSDPLLDLMPAVKVETVTDVSLEPYRDLLTSSEFDDVAMPDHQTIQTFTIEPGTEPGDAAAICSGPNGCVVARRIVGAGMVSLVGIPIGTRELAHSEVLRADALWHRVLGYRFDTLTSKKQLTPGMRLGAAGFPLIINRFFGAQITQRSAANAGMLLAVLLFIAYWLAAGPIGHWVLSRLGLVRHSWVGFVGAIAVFAIAAWVGSTMTRPTRIRATHLTFLDHVHGQSTQRCTTWASILLPDYGDATIRLDEPGVNDQWRQAISVWSDSQETALAASFPDSRAYVYDLRTPEQITVPTRATIKQFKFEWIGGKRWETPIAAGAGAEPRITEDGRLEGVLTHNLPGPLENVVVFFQPGQTSESEQWSTGNLRLIAQTRRWFISGSWAPGQNLDLKAGLPWGDAVRGMDVFKPFAPPVTSLYSHFGTPEESVFRQSDADLDYRRLSLYSMLDPPEYRVDPTGTNSRPLVRRMEGQSLDISRWFTQPALIIIGTVAHPKNDSSVGAPSPTPIFLRDGSRYREIPSEGPTIVRWVYPLRGAPARFDGSAVSNRPPSEPDVDPEQNP